MTTKYDKTIKCANCGKEITKTVITSTSAFGYPDLDTRPATPARFVQEDLVDYCGECCYASYDLEEITDDVKKIIDTDEYYKYIYSFPYYPPLRGYMGVGYIHLKLGKYESAFDDFLNASWIYDDRALKNNDNDTPNVGRDYCIGLFDKHLIDSNDIEYHLINLDQLRRNKEFDKAKERALGILDKFKLSIKDDERKVVELQLKLIAEKDIKVYTTDKALNN